jgi:hypothetical protein
VSNTGGGQDLEILHRKFARETTDNLKMGENDGFLKIKPQG